MDRIGKPRGLIRYTSENELEGVSTRAVRPRTIIYTVLLVLIFSAFTVVLHFAIGKLAQYLTRRAGGTE